MTQKQAVLNALSSFGFPLQQCEIADRISEPSASVRRCVQQLVKEGKVIQKDTLGFPGYAPRFVAVPATPSNG
jgi:DNA-binding IclR family transcriptional regulator